MADLSKDAQKIMDLVKEMSAVDLNQLVKGLEEEFGVTAAATVVAVAGGDAGGDAGGAGNDSVNIELTEIGQQKIAIIKVVKELLGLGLKEAKELVEKAPTILKENVKSDEADAIKEKLQAEGATVSFK
ncbi:50S ribosomal protein L7/L12 [Patescibacteria group bacterium]|nr:50S ribosomal protein L7/L12 [Patescibacteria group bacterium]MBU1757811.1 50S ribosomal protein L7/L12 [Patescibacteria group bacterium]